MHDMSLGSFRIKACFRIGAEVFLSKSETSGHLAALVWPGWPWRRCQKLGVRRQRGRPCPNTQRRKLTEEAVIEEPTNWRCVRQAAGPWRSFSICLKVWPCGTHGRYFVDSSSDDDGSSEWEDCFSVAVHVLPPRSSASKWVCSDVEVELEVRNFKDEASTIRRFWRKTFCEKSCSVGKRPLLPSRHLTTDEGLVNAPTATRQQQDKWHSQKKAALWYLFCGLADLDFRK